MKKRRNSLLGKQRLDPEFRYSNLFELASLRIPFVPIFQSDQAEDPPEYKWNEVSVDILPTEFRLPRDFQRNPLPRHLENAPSGEIVDHLGKCRFVSYRAEFTPPGSHGRLTIALEKTNYVDYLRSGECLDRPVSSHDRTTYRDKYAPEIQSLRDFANWKLTNICGVGLFLITSDNKIIVSQHSGDVAVFPNVLSFSASGTMDWNTIAHPFTGDPASNPNWRAFLNPFSQIGREAFEELNYHIDPENIRLFGLGIDAKRLYFQFSFYERSSLTAREIIAGAPRARDFFKEMASLRPVDFKLSDLTRLIMTEKWEPASRAALLSLCAREFGFEHVERAIDPGFVSKRWKRRMIDEWTKRAQRDGEASVMSSRYPAHMLSAESRRYVTAVLKFIGKDIFGKDIVEFGCGNGRLTERLVTVARQITCVDLCRTMMETCCSRIAAKPNAKCVRFVLDFGQDYHPPVKHEVAICSLVMVHNVEDEEFHGFARAIADSSDTLFLFEHVGTPRIPHPHTRIRTASELIAAFPGFDVVRKASYALFSDRLVFLKLQRRELSRPRLGKNMVCRRLRPAMSPAPITSQMGGSQRRRKVTFDVFLSHNSANKPIVRQIARALKSRGLRVWLDEWELVPGRPWQEAIEEVIESVKAAAILVGGSGFGPWERPEMRGCLSEFVARGLPVIPVLLPGAPKLPVFLKQFTWVDLRAGLNRNGLDRLVWGIIGKKPPVRF